LRRFAFGALGVIALCLTAQAQVVSSGTITIPGTFEFSFDTGVLSLTNPDIFWDMNTDRLIMPQGTAGIVNLGAANFAGLTSANLQALTYGAGTIDGGPFDDGSNFGTLVAGDVFAVHTNGGNYAKVLVTGPIVPGTSDNGLPIQWVTYSPGAATTPAPPAFFLIAASLAAVAMFRYRQKLAGLLRSDS